MQTVDTAELSDLAIDMRLRLQTELALRAINRASFSSCQSESGSLKEPEGMDLGNEFHNFLPPVDVSQSVSENVKVTTTSFSGSMNITDLHNEHDHAKEILENRIADKIDHEYQSRISSRSSRSKTLQNPFDSLISDSGCAGKMAAMMIDLSAEEFIPGDKCEEKLVADESAWMKENIPPATGPTSTAISDLDFSGIVGNAEISLHSVDVSHNGHPKKKVSVGEFFRLKSEQFDGLGTKSNNMDFAMQAKSPDKGHKLLPLVEDELDYTAPQEESGNNEDCTKETEKIRKSHSFFDGGKSSLHSSEQNNSLQESLSLSCIADILANVDTCGSPRTVVSNILKQSGLCNSKRFLPIKTAIAPQPSCSGSISDGDGKDTSVESKGNFCSGSKKEHFSILSHSKCDTSSSSDSNKCVHSKKGVPVLNAQKVLSHTLINISDFSDEKGKLSYSNLKSLPYDGDDSTVSDESSDGWVFSVPNASVGVGAVLCSSSLKAGQKNEDALTLNKENKSHNQTFTLEDNISARDLNVHGLTSLIENKQLDQSIECLMQEHACMPEKPVECSALVSTLKKTYPELQLHPPEVNMKNARSGSKAEWNLSIPFVKSDDKMSIIQTEEEISVQSVMSASCTITSGMFSYPLKLSYVTEFWNFTKEKLQ